MFIFKRAESWMWRGYCQQSSTGLLGSAYICTLRQEGRRPLSTVFNCSVGFCSYSLSASNGSKTLVTHLWCLCRRISLNSNLSQMGWKPLL